jgi:hypothetical protein
MKPLLLQEGQMRTETAERADGYGITFKQGRDLVAISWDEAIRIRDWLQLAIAEHTEKVHSQRTGADTP